jgi:hypothetical protein
MVSSYKDAKSVLAKKRIKFAILPFPQGSPPWEVLVLGRAPKRDNSRSSPKEISRTSLTVGRTT